MIRVNRYDQLNPPYYSCLHTKSGMSLIEVMVIVAIMGVTMFVVTSMYQFQLQANNYLQFQLKRTQLHNTLVGQFFNDPNNCACLFAGSAPFPDNPISPGATLTGPAPTQIGRYDFVTPGDCTTATIPQPLVDSTGIDGLKTTLIQLTDIMNISGKYSGTVLINLRSTKTVSGPQDLPIKIPVSIITSPAGGSNVNFVSCSTAGDGTTSNLKLVTDDFDLLAVNNYSLPEGRYLVFLNSRVHPSVAKADYSYSIQLQTSSGPTQIQTSFADTGDSDGTGSKVSSNFSSGVIDSPAGGTTISYQITENDISPSMIIIPDYIRITVIKIE
jgi:hypothetical protein